MEAALRDLFAANEVILAAIYAQAYFVLGLAVALQWRRESRLALARSVPLLAAFGLLKAVVVWGDIFIPVQQELVAPSELALLRLLQLLLTLAAYAALLHFGMSLNWHSAWVPRLAWLLAGLGGATVVAAHLNGLDSALLRLRFEQLSRPLLLFPAAMVAAWGMRSAARQIEAMALPSHIVGWLRVAGGSFGAYALFGGLFVPLSASAALRVNEFALWGLPVALLRLLAVGGLAWAMIQALTIFRLELQRAMEEMGRLRALDSDRQRIGRELHDGTIQAIYAAGLMLDNARSQMRADPDAAESMFAEGLALLNRTIADVRRFIFELSEEEGQLPEALGLLVDELRVPPDINLEYRLSGIIPRYSAEVRNHLVQMSREALSNALKHADAHEIVLALRGESDALLLTISDDGRGLPPGGAFRPGGQGIPNLRARAALLGGALHLHSRPGGGLTVEIVVPHPPSGSPFVKESHHETSSDPVGG